MLARQSMTRKGKKPTIAQLEERIDKLELAVGELQQFCQFISHAAKNDMIRHEDMIQQLCEKAGIEFKMHPIPEENIEESQGGSE